MHSRICEFIIEV